MTVLEQEIKNLKVRVTTLERKFSEGENQYLKPPLPNANEPFNAQLFSAWLRAEGLLRLPTDEEKQLASKWSNLPENRKQAHIQTMNNLILDAPLSQIIMESRR